MENNDYINNLKRCITQRNTVAYELAVSVRDAKNSEFFSRETLALCTLLGLGKVSVCNMVRVANRFICDTDKPYRSIIAHGNTDYSVTQLIELLPLQTGDIMKLNDKGIIAPEMTCKEIRKRVKEYKKNKTANKPEITENESENSFKAICAINALINDTRAQNDSVLAFNLERAKVYINNNY